MNDGQSRESRTHRARLGQELQRVRVLAGLSGRQIADTIGVSQSTVSRIERGDSVPSIRQVNTWTEAAGASDDKRALLASLAEIAVNEVTTHRARLAEGGLAAVQDSVHDLEQTARMLRHFQPGIIPGLLQTAEYARRILTFADPAADIGQAIAARLARQQSLYEPGRSCVLLLTEAALRFRPPGPREVLTGQLDHLAATVTLEAISFGVIPADAEMHAIIRCGFILYEDRIDDQPPFAFVETPHASLTASDPADVAVYQSQLEAFRRSAVYGTEAIDIVRSIAHPLTNKKGQRSLCTRSRHGHTARRQLG
jgi:transcriptional regulator with XRE-family HTH domain